ncbi:CFEM domain-containing protein [Sodiomyces alkalinus F11]|uniref:CFEM domain-containing protein n=1 Tax=Sodiomyces alkalinus (strain CBS 110278 / VKM F-3762 / F11) TaxID=1314773 RepID=A0A3N2QAQ2_SODAK|nr:CFEM domain-containing protein [Sodiomyces alkalinus F11]ROT43748.1 CFEM domain-containing protein [Sodiomyces alkalinus F11]
MVRLSAHRLLAVVIQLAVWTLVQAQETDPLASLMVFPECARPCIATAFMGGLCAPTDQACICGDEQFQQNVTLCVSESCIIPDMLATRNTSLTNCNVPVRDRSGDYVVISNAMAVTAAIFLVIRFVYKIFMAHVELGMDDWIILAAAISMIPSAVITVHGSAANGLGRDIWTLEPEQITKVLMYFYCMAFLYFAQVALVKLSIISFFMRIFPARETQRLLWGTFIFTTVYGAAFVLTAIFQCWPVHYFWTKWDGLHEGSCASANAISWSNAAINIALDLWMLAVPLWQVRSLQLHWKKKIGVALMFVVGTFVTVVSALRLQSLVIFGASSNATWEFYSVSVWSTIEITVGIMCACLPSIRLVLVRLFPALRGTTMRSMGQYYRGYGSNTNGTNRDRSGAAETPRRNGTMTGVSAVRSQRRGSEDEEGGTTTPPGGIVFQKSYTVQYSDNDEASLVRMDDLDSGGKSRGFA